MGNSFEGSWQSQDGIVEWWSGLGSGDRENFVRRVDHRIDHNHPAQVLTVLQLLAHEILTAACVCSRDNQ